jgi:hypothetical protein
MKHQAVYQSRDELAGVLREMTRRVEAGDSMEGFIEYLLPDEGDEPDGFRVRARFRIGNLQGQGGMRIVGRLQ